MARPGAVAAVTLLAFIAACTPGNSPGKSPAGGDLEIASEIEGSGSVLREGELATLVFRIRNATRNPVLLRDLTQPRDLMLSGSGGAVVTWQYSQPGLLTYSTDKDEWTYEKGRRADAPRPVFNSGLIVPGETLVVRARFRLLEMPLDFQFSYFELTADELRRKVYFETRVDKVSRYRTLVGRELEERLIPSTRPEQSGHRFVIFPHAEPIGSHALLKTFRLQQPLKLRLFSVEHAARKAGVAKPRAGDYTYTTVFDAWVLPKDSGHVLVTPAAVTALPEIRQIERLFHLLDSNGPVKIEIELRAHAAASALADLKYPLVRQEREIPVTKEVKEKRSYYFLFLLPDQFPRFLTDLRTLKLALDVEHGDGGGRLLVLNR